MLLPRTTGELLFLNDEEEMLKKHHFGILPKDIGQVNERKGHRKRLCPPHQFSRWWIYALTTDVDREFKLACLIWKTLESFEVRF